jgi:hypothetical protein
MLFGMRLRRKDYNLARTWYRKKWRLCSNGTEPSFPTDETSVRTGQSVWYIHLLFLFFNFAVFCRIVFFWIHYRKRIKKKL